MFRIPEQVPKLTQENVRAIKQLEQLKRLLRHRRFVKDVDVRQQTQFDRLTYIRLALDLGKQADYNERRLFRLGHEFNRSFQFSMSPADAHSFIQSELETEMRDYNAQTWIDFLGMTEEEYILITKTDTSTLVGKEVFE